MVYSTEEYCNMYLIFGECNRNARLAEARYAAVYGGGGRQMPSFNTFLRLDQRLRATGSLAPARMERGNVGDFRHRERNLRFEEAVLRRVERDPTTSVREIARHLHSSKSKVNRILKRNGLYPYHNDRVQFLEDRDYYPRRKYCRWLNANWRKVPFILWTDECNFTREGSYNTRNTHVYAEENPRNYWERNNQHRFTINVWAGIVDGTVVGPYVLPDRMNGNNYLIFLNEILPELLEDVPLETRRRLIYMHDGCPAHRTANVVNHLYRKFGNNWIGFKSRAQTHRQWPPRSPDLTPLDFYLWGYVKSLVYKTPLPRDQNEAQMELMARIHAAFASLPEEQIRRASQSTLQRARQCLLVGGRQCRDKF